MVPGVVRVARERLALDDGEVGDPTELVAPLTTGVPTVSAGSETSCVTATTTEGAFCGWMSISEP